MAANIWKSFKGMLFLGLLLSGIFPHSTLAEVSTDTITKFNSVPISSTGNSVTPLVMLNLSRDHQLTYKAYNDFSDLDNDVDKKPETTYADNVDYYGYFDSKKCYTYYTSPDNHFHPVALAVDPYSHHCNVSPTTNQWSGNFLNWATMTRMDVVRKLLYGGMRVPTLDTNARTVLERHYLPTDAHTFAKWYNGTDIATLTPFSGINNTYPTATSSTSCTIPSHTTGTVDITFTTALPVTVGDQIKAFITGQEASQWMVGGVTSTNAGTITIQIPARSYAGAGITSPNWTLQNLSQTGITLCNLTPGDNSGSSANRYSDTNTNPPYIRVAKGNFALWTANERWQAYWSEQKSNTQSGFTDGFRSNGNKAYLSGLNASAENPSQTTHGLGTGSAQGEYIARVEACVSGLIGDEKCKQYGSSWKPIGLLQVYGDTDRINFGMMTGTFAKNISGGVLRKNVTSFTNEINSADGTFVSGAHGIVDNMNGLRLYGYDYNDGSYIGHDSCNYQQTGLVHSGGSTAQGSAANEGNCSSWGNPMSEIYLESLRYLAGKTANTDFTNGTGTGSKDAALHLTVADWADPLTTAKKNYCAPLNVLNFSASVSSYDGDQMAGISDLLRPPDSTSTAQTLTNKVGEKENIDTASWFIGSNGTTSDGLCTSKPIVAAFGSFSGICPEAPTQQGTYLMSGVALYANTHRIRSDLPVPAARTNSHDLEVSTYGIALATNVPKIEVLVGVNKKKITILPAYRLDVSSNGTGPFGAGTLVDFKIITQTPTYGKFYVNWEDSEMGGDYDQDMWGVIEYSVSGENITITTDAVSASTANGQGFGYIISGTNNQDGAHFHSGIYGFDYSDPTGVTGCNNCVVGDPPTSYTYTASGASAGVLQDPLWYAAKYGGFTDSDPKDNFPGPQQSEWDNVNNSTGASGPDNIPDNYFYATNPLQLENSLNKVFLSIIQRATSGTAAAVVSNNVSGTGALYQAYYEPLREDGSKNVRWIGTVRALWLDSFGYLREDTNGDARLGNYNTDKVIQMFFDDTQNKTRIRSFSSTLDDVFTPFYMQGFVSTTSTGSVTFTVDTIGGSAGSGPFNDWTITNLTTGETGSSTTSSRVIAVDNPIPTPFTVSPSTMLFHPDDKVKISRFDSKVMELEDVVPLWNARERLSAISVPETQRSSYDNTADTGRYIMTWFDSGSGMAANDFNGVVDTGEFVPFDSTHITASNFGYFNVATQSEAATLTDYIRGKEITGYRNRTINYDTHGDKVQRLGDIVNSTPTVVGAPQEEFDLLYQDSSYPAFKKQYANRRQMVYVGSNDGILHAFNGGFYDATNQAFLISGKKNDGTAATQHPLGSEIWGYVPMNLLPHLKWLKDLQYGQNSHVYYMDGKPKVFDAKIFTKDADHPGLTTDSKGWGTVMVVGMRLGGGQMTIDTAADGLTGEATPVDNRTLSSAYVIMDITNPEAPPTLLAEIQIPDGSFSTTYPAVFAVKDKDPSIDANKWFLTFGSGPTNSTGLATVTSTTTAKFYVFDLEEIARPGSSSASTPPGTTCTRPAVNGSGGSMKILSCDTGIANSFVGDPMTVDWQLNYKADSVYFGIVGDQTANSGQVMRLDINENADPASWIAPATFINTSQPVVSSATPAIDDLNQRWIFFGTGRYFSSNDKTSTTQQSIYGIKENESSSAVNTTSLINVSTAQVDTNSGELANVTTTGSIPTPITTVTDLETEIAKPATGGWLLNLPLIQGTASSVPAPPATRVVSSSALTGGVLFTSAYQPGIDLCMGEGFSRLYGLFYKTGTAFPEPAVLGTQAIGGKMIARSFIELGYGFATTPSLHSGSGSGADTVNVFTQLSTGTINKTEATTVLGVRSKMDSWKEQR